MLKGWLIYDSVGKARNEWFIQHIIEIGREKGLEIKLIVTDGELPSHLPDFAIVRTINPKINYFLQNNGVVTFNNYVTSKVANDKWETYILCKNLGIPVMETFLFDGKTVPYGIGLPAIVKSVDGHGGAQVFMATDQASLNDIAQKLVGKKSIIQRPSSTLGKDMRVYCLSDDIVAGVLRQSDSDFRSNFSLGGSATLTEVTGEQRDIIKKLKTQLQFDFVGIDFIIDGGHWVLNEIEDVVGTRMLYSCTEGDIVEKYLQYIKNKLTARA
jgi:glutathione synthase/RimK-type ligase-like ATP-grasp enzyme